MRRLCAALLVFAAAGCWFGDADRPGDESGESTTSGGNASQAMHDATGTGDPVHEDDEAAATGTDASGQSAPTGTGDASGTIGSGVEAAGGGATGVRESGAEGSSGEAPGESGTDPGDT